VLSADYRDVDLVPLDGPGKARRLGTHDGVDWVTLSPDGRWAVTAGGEGAGAVRVWDVARGALVRELHHEGGYYAATFSPDGRWLLTSVRGEYRVWEAGSWQLRRRLPRHPGALYGHAAFARDGRVVALAHARHLVRLHDPATWRHLATLEVPGGKGMAGLSLSADGRRLAANTGHGFVALWDLRALRGELAALGLDW
jgi:WD40 repeat protein